MKFKVYAKAAVVAAIGIFGVWACSDDKNDDPSMEIVIKDENGNIQLTIKNLNKWTSAARRVANELAEDVRDHISDWTPARAEAFKNQPVSKSIAEIIEDCADEAEDVATEKITNPLAIFTTGDDCVANLISIRNSLLGSLDGTMAQASIMELATETDPTVAQAITEQLTTAVTSVQAIPRPLKDNTRSPEAKAAAAACLQLQQTLNLRLAPLMASLTGHDTDKKEIVATYVDAVVLPSVEQARIASNDLIAAINQLTSDPTEQNIAASLTAYVKARGALDLCESFADN